MNRNPFSVSGRRGPGRHCVKLSTRRIDHTRTSPSYRTRCRTHRRLMHAAPQPRHCHSRIQRDGTATIDLKTVQAPVLAMAERLTDQWLVHADTHALPHEDLPLPLPAGRTGADYGWPDKMMGATTFQMLADRQITKTSQLIQLAECMTQAQFEAYFEGTRPCWGYLRRAVEENRPDYDERLRRWQADQYNVNNRILGEWLFRREPPHGPPHPPPVPALPRTPIYPPFGRSELLDAAAGERVIAENWARQGCIDPLPQEDLPVHLRHGETGAHYGWPHLMMGASTLQMLADRQITRTSQLIQLASCMTEAQFQAYVGGTRPCWRYLISLVNLRPENYSEYERRKGRWLADQCVVNSRILDGWLMRRRRCEGDPPLGPRLDPGNVISLGGRDLNQLQLVEDTIAENEKIMKGVKRL